MKHIKTPYRIDSNIAAASQQVGKPDADYIKLIKKHGNNLRAALMDIEAGAML